MSHKDQQSAKKLNKQKKREPSPFVAEMFTAALQHHQIGDLHEAEQFYRQVLAVDPSHADSLHLLGVLAHQIGQHREAVDLISQAIAINTQVALYHSNLGNAFKALGKREEAVTSYRKAINLNPRYPEAYNNMGTALQDQKQLDKAVLCFQKALDLKPDFPEAYNNKGNVLIEQGHTEEAILCYQKAIALRQNYPEAHNNLGTALKALDRLDEAIVCYQKALDLKPDFLEAYNNLGIAFKKQGRIEEAVACCRQAIVLNPHISEAHYNLGVALADQGLLDEAITCYRHALELKPQAPETHNNLAMALLARGDMTEGWQEYEWRWQTAGMLTSHRQFVQPQWRGEAANNRTLLIHAEQGLGDTLQFCRYAPLAAAAGFRVIMEVQKPLIRLLRQLPGVDTIVAQGEDLPAFDLHCPMLSMPMALGTTLATIPNAPSYLSADAEQTSLWQTRLATLNIQGPKIGLAWAGNTATASNQRRSLAPDQLAALLHISGLHFFSLQKDGPARPENLLINDFMNEMSDFTDTAAFVSNLDLVISVDTAIAHLAAALGKPVWLLDRFDPDWRWLTRRRDSPWYPTLRIYRQPHLGDWSSVLTEVAHDLRGGTY